MSVCERQRRRIQPGLLAESTAHWSPIKTLAALQVRLRFETTCHRASRDYGSYTICKPLHQWGARLNAGPRIICGISKRRAVPLRNRPYCWVYLLQRFRTDRWGLNFSGFKWFAGNQGVRHLGWRWDSRSLSPSSVSQHPSPPLCPNTPVLLFGDQIRLFHPGVNLIQRIYTEMNKHRIAVAPHSVTQRMGHRGPLQEWIYMFRLCFSEKPLEVYGD